MPRTSCRMLQRSQEDVESLWGSWNGRQRERWIEKEMEKWWRINSRDVNVVCTSVNDTLVVADINPSSPTSAVHCPPTVPRKFYLPMEKVELPGLLHVLESLQRSSSFWVRGSTCLASAVPCYQAASQTGLLALLNQTSSSIFGEKNSRGMRFSWWFQSWDDLHLIPVMYIRLFIFFY